MTDAEIDLLLAAPMLKDTLTIADGLTLGFEDWNMRRTVLESGKDDTSIVNIRIVTKMPVPIAVAKRHLKRLMEIEKQTLEKVYKPD